MQLKVLNTVYEPREDSYLLQKEVEKRAKGKRVLDMGCGTGIQAITAAKAGAEEVWACDINSKAVKCCKENAKLNRVEVRVVESDLFRNVPQNEFQLIVFNPPYLPSDGQHDDLRWSGGYEGIEVVIDFFKRVSEYLTKDGEVLFIFSSHANQDKLKEVLKRLGFSLKVIAKQRIFFEEIYVGLATLQ